MDLETDGESTRSADLEVSVDAIPRGLIRALHVTRASVQDLSEAEVITASGIEPIAVQETKDS